MSLGMGHSTQGRRPFTPRSLSGGLMWLRGDMGITPAAGKAAAWADQFGLGNDFAQGNTAWQPVINASNANMGSKQTLTFTSSMVGLTRANFALAKTQLTVSITYRMAISAGAPRIFGPPTSAGGAPNFIANSGVPSFDAVVINGGTNMTRVTPNVINVNYVRTTVMDIGNAATVDALVYTNGVVGGSVPSSTASSGSVPATTWNIGYLFDGDIAEIVVYDRLLSSTEVAALAAYQLAWVT